MAHFEKNQSAKAYNILKCLALHATVLFSTGCLAAASNTAPLAPSALTATATSTSQVSLSFTDNSSNEQGFVIMRSLNSSTGFAQIATLSANVVTFSDAGLSASTPYYYRVAAFRKVKGTPIFSAYSNLATVTTLAPTPPPPPPPSTPTPVPTTSTPTPPSTAGTRDPLKQPFASTSIWNMPIGSNAQFAPANLQANPGGNVWATLSNPDPERIVLTPTAPLTTFNYSSAGWSGANRCDATGGANYGLPISVPMPTNYVIPSDNNNDGAAFLAADGRTVIQMQPVARCVAGGPGTALVALSSWVVDLYGDGIAGSHGGSGLSSLGGTIRLGELRPGQQGMRHALKLDIPVSELYHATVRSESYRWPASTSDSSWATYGVGGPNANNPAMKMGALLAIPSTTSISSLGLETEAGRQMAWTMQNYGVYIVDTYGGYDAGYAVEDGYAGSFQAQFKADYGFAFMARYNDYSPWSRDLVKLNLALEVVNNNSPTSIGGGGTPLQPLAPPIAP